MLLLLQGDTTKTQLERNSIGDSAKHAAAHCKASERCVVDRDRPSHSESVYCSDSYDDAERELGVIAALVRLLKSRAAAASAVLTAVITASGCLLL